MPIIFQFCKYKDQIISLLMICICAFYIIAYSWLVPEIGFSLNDRWEISDISSCNKLEDWCIANEGKIFRGDKVEQIGELTYEAYILSW